MAIKTLGPAQKIRVGRKSGNTKLIFLGLNLKCYCSYFFSFILKPAISFKWMVLSDNAYYGVLL